MPPGGDDLWEVVRLGMDVTPSQDPPGSDDLWEVVRLGMDVTPSQDPPGGDDLWEVVRLQGVTTCGRWCASRG